MAGQAGTILLSRREYNPPEAAVAGDWQKASIDRRSDLRPIRVFYRAGRPAAVYLRSAAASTTHVSGKHQTPVEHESLYGRYFPVDEIVVACRQTRSADRDCVKRGRCCPSVCG